MIEVDKSVSTWPWLRRDIDHAFRVDRRNPIVGFINRDEAAILFSNARLFAGRQGHRDRRLARLVDRPSHRLGPRQRSMSSSLCLRTRIGGPSLSKWRAALAAKRRQSSFRKQARKPSNGSADSGLRWSFAFIDGDHDGEAPSRDALACAPFLEETSMVLFHDLVSPHVAKGLRALEERGWNVMAYQTAQMLGVAWRGEVAPVAHKPDPTQSWRIPDHLKGIAISGVMADG